MHGLVVLGSERRPLRPAILWNDGRSQPQATRIEEELGIERLVALSGNRALAGFTAPKLTWLAEHEPDVHRQIERVLLPKDYVRFRLTGELATDVSDASGTVLLDVGRRAWSAELGEAFAVDPAGCPPCTSPRRVTGHTPPACRWPPARAIRRRGHSASASPTTAARPRSSSAPAASSSPPATPSPRTRRGACTRSATRCPTPGM